MWGHTFKPSSLEAEDELCEFKANLIYRVRNPVWKNRKEGEEGRGERREGRKGREGGKKGGRNGLRKKQRNKVSFSRLGST